MTDETDNKNPYLDVFLIARDLQEAALLAFHNSPNYGYTHNFDRILAELMDYVNNTPEGES